jgi:DNA-binding MarR family transcriptional regulator
MLRRATKIEWRWLMRAEIRESFAWNAHRVTRQLTKIYREALRPAALNINQFGLLAYLYGAKLEGRASVSIHALAEFTGLDLSALPRQLKPLTTRGWIASATDTADRRKCAVSITPKGQVQLRRAVPLWRGAQMRIRHILGAKTALTLNDILDRTSTRLRK